MHENTPIEITDDTASRGASETQNRVLPFPSLIGHHRWIADAPELSQYREAGIPPKPRWKLILFVCRGQS